MSEEQTVFRGSPSILTRFGAIFLCFLISAAAIAFIFVVRDPRAKYALGVLAGIAFVYILIIILLVKATQYEVTSERIRVRKGIFTKRTDELELYRVNDTSLIEPFTMRLFGLGTVEIRTMDTSNPRLYLEAVHGARNLREELRRCVEQCRDRKGVRVTEFENPPPSA